MLNTRPLEVSGIGEAHAYAPNVPKRDYHAYYAMKRMVQST